jgi:hypothetical protein
MESAIKQRAVVVEINNPPSKNMALLFFYSADLAGKSSSKKYSPLATEFV